MEYLAATYHLIFLIIAPSVRGMDVNKEFSVAIYGKNTISTLAPQKIINSSYRSQCAAACIQFSGCKGFNLRRINQGKGDCEMFSAESSTADILSVGENSVYYRRGFYYCSDQRLCYMYGFGLNFDEAVAMCPRLHPDAYLADVNSAEEDQGFADIAEKMSSIMPEPETDRPQSVTGRASRVNLAPVHQAKKELSPSKQPAAANNRDSTSHGAPLIQISHLSPGSKGQDNAGYIGDDGGDDVSGYSMSRPVSPASRLSPTSTPSLRFSRRSSQALPASHNSKLDVPGVRRRHSVAGSSDATIPDIPDDDVIPDGDDPFKDHWGTGGSTLGGGMATLGVDHLGVNMPPRSPGGRSMRSDWSELVRLERSDSIGSFQSMGSCSVPNMSSLNTGDDTSAISSAMSTRIKDLIRKFSSRTEKFRERTIQPPSPSSECSELDRKSMFSAVSGVSARELEPPGRQHRLDSFIPMSRASGAESILAETYFGYGRCQFKLPQFIRRHIPSTINPTSRIYIFWLFLVTMAFMYNAGGIILRAAFKAAPFMPDIVLQNETQIVCVPDNSTGSTVWDNATAAGAGNFCYNITKLVEKEVIRYYPGYETDENRIYWWIVDYVCDLIYILDIIFVKTRMRFINNGLTEKNPKITAKHYFRSSEFKLDILSLTPLEIFYLIPAANYNALLRIPRILKIKTFWEFYDRVDQMVSSAHIIRVIRTLTYMLYLIHIEAAGYYAVSAYEGLNSNEWVYSGRGSSYVRCMYLATKTATSIGSNPRPTNTLEYGFMIVYWLSGVFVFAMLIGQIRDIVQSAGLAQEQYRRTMDSTLFYMNSLNLPKDIQARVRMWFNYNWENSKTLDENMLLEALPKKMKADLAIHVHFNTLSKVQLFQDCDKNLLFDLVLKLKPSLYLPHDYICRKGEIGTEMYIVMQGQVEVVGGENNSIVFATLHEGSVFGEISLLALAGCNRRTADVRSKGFAQLFILSKNDFEEAMREYPAAARILKKRAKKLLAQNAKHDNKTDSDEKAESEEIIKSRSGTPKLLKTVVQIVAPGSHIHDYLGMHPSITNHKSTHSGHNSRASGKVSQASIRAISQMSNKSNHRASSRASNKSTDGVVHNEHFNHEEGEQELKNPFEGDDWFKNIELSDELEDEEVLVIEKIERHLTPEELHLIKQANLHPQDSVDSGVTSPQEAVVSSDLGSNKSLRSGIASILDTPTDIDPLARQYDTGTNARTTPATLRYEVDNPGTPKKSVSLQNSTTVALSGTNSIQGGKDAKEALNHQISASRAGAAPKISQNKMQPVNNETDTRKVQTSATKKNGSNNGKSHTNTSKPLIGGKTKVHPMEKSQVDPSKTGDPSARMKKSSADSIKSGNNETRKSEQSNRPNAVKSSNPTSKNKVQPAENKHVQMKTKTESDKKTNSQEPNQRMKDSDPSKIKLVSPKNSNVGDLDPYTACYMETFKDDTMISDNIPASGHDLAIFNAKKSKVYGAESPNISLNNRSRLSGAELTSVGEVKPPTPKNPIINQQKPQNTLIVQSNEIQSATIRDAPVSTNRVTERPPGGQQGLSLSRDNLGVDNTASKQDGVQQPPNAETKF